jgi:hypothetical protein
LGVLAPDSGSLIASGEWYNATASLRGDDAEALAAIFPDGDTGNRVFLAGAIAGVSDEDRGLEMGDTTLLFTAGFAFSTGNLRYWLSVETSMDFNPWVQG